MKENLLKYNPSIEIKGNIEFKKECDPIRLIKEIENFIETKDYVNSASIDINYGE